jgi:hypothetical protein
MRLISVVCFYIAIIDLRHGKLYLFLPKAVMFMER